MVARSALVACVLTASCSRPADTAAVDAAPDVASCSGTFTFTPVTVTGTSPGGPLDVFHFAFAGFIVGGACPPDSYLIHFTPTALAPPCTSAPWLQLAIVAPFTATGTNSARRRWRPV